MTTADAFPRTRLTTARCTLRPWRIEDIPLIPPVAHTATVGYWLGPEHWGRGLGTEIVGELVRFMREETDVEQLTANVFAWNPASGRVLEKTGFVLEGTRRGVVRKWDKTTDLWIYGKML